MPALYIGLMSGTSMDGVDAVLCEFEDQHFVRTAGRETRAYPAALRASLLQLQREKPALRLEQLCQLDNAVAEVFADAANALMRSRGLAPSTIQALGSHGQTVFHDPSHTGSSLQIGNASLIAARTGVTTVSDFRRADITRGGQGAPLVPAFHHALFASDREARCVINIGGIANVSLLPGTEATHVLGFDTGPGNGLMDEWIERHCQTAYDADGAWARGGQVREDLLAALLDEPYFRQPPPKSTGRDRFNLEWAARRFPSLPSLAPQDVQRSFCELTARSIADALADPLPRCRRALVCGGGTRNSLLMERLRALLPGVEVDTTDTQGLAASDVEAAAFAWLAMRALHRLPGNLPAVTGASAAAILGGIYLA